MVAVPMEECRDLLLELESVQRAVLYHCPKLVRACIVPVVTRMPLLLVDASDAPRDEVTQALQTMVQTVVNELIFVPSTNFLQQPQNSYQMEFTSTIGGPNKDGIRPLMMKFHGLEVEGDRNEVLLTPAKEGDEGTLQIRHVVEVLQQRIESKYGWKTAFPLDNPQDEDIQAKLMLDPDTGKPTIFRPRIPFMRLPENFESTLSPLERNTNQESDDDDGSQFWDDNQRSPEEGGNGISPIFWYKWWEDAYGGTDGVRLRQIGIYPRSGPIGMSEASFYCHRATVDLPQGNQMLTKAEERDKAYNEKRFSPETDREFSTNDDSNQDEPSTTTNPDPLFRNTIDANVIDTTSRTTQESDVVTQDAEADQDQAIRKIMDRAEAERMYTSPSLDDVTMFADSSTEVDEPTSPEELSPLENNNSNNNNLPYREEAPAAIDNSDRIRNIVNNRAYIRAREPQSLDKSKKEKPSIQDNPIFQDWRNKVAASNKDGSSRMDGGVTSSTTTTPTMPPFPSNEYFVGIWKMMDYRMDDTNDDEDDTMSENLILRVDGTTAGGPTLDSKLKQKAAGGTWRIFEAQKRITNDDSSSHHDEEEEEEVTSTRLRIELVIPPKKEQLFVMEGEVTRIQMPSSKSLNTDKFLASSAPATFGIPELEQLVDSSRETMANSLSEQTTKLEQGLLHCGGEAWLQDILVDSPEDDNADDSMIGNKKKRPRRVKLGNFSIIKYESKDPSQYRYTIPPPRSVQD
jgi:hypothetical protein